MLMGKKLTIMWFTGVNLSDILYKTNYGKESLSWLKKYQISENNKLNNT